MDDTIPKTAAPSPGWEHAERDEQHGRHGRSGGTGGHFDGKIEAPRVVRRILDAAALRGISAGTRSGSADADVVAYWDFSIGINTLDVVDVSANRLDGRRSNMEKSRIFREAIDVSKRPLPPDLRVFLLLGSKFDTITHFMWDDENLIPVESRRAATAPSRCKAPCCRRRRSGCAVSRMRRRNAS